MEHQIVWNKDSVDCCVCFPQSFSLSVELVFVLVFLFFHCSLPVLNYMYAPIEILNLYCFF